MQAEARVTSSPTPSTGSILQIKPLVYVFTGIFIAAAVIYGVINTGQPPDVVITIFATLFLGIFIEAVPFLLLGTITSGLIEAFIRPDDLVRYLPRNPVLATLCGAFMGIVFPVCECGVVPVVRRLFIKGLPVSVGITFLLAAPFMNPIVFASTYLAFGIGTVFIGRFLLTAIVAIAVGLIFALTSRPEEVLQTSSMLSEDAFESLQPRRNMRQGISMAMTIAAGEFFEMGRFLVMGCLLAAAMRTLIPQETLLAAGTTPVSSVLIMLALAFILSICSTVDAFVALMFSGTFTTGSILAFLSFGPMVDIKSTMMFTGVFKRKVVFYLVLLPFLMNLLAGVIINLSGGYF
jgi:uncharacterized protein